MESFEDLTAYLDEVVNGRDVSCSLEQEEFQEEPEASEGEEEQHEMLETGYLVMNVNAFDPAEEEQEAFLDYSESEEQPLDYFMGKSSSDSPSTRSNENSDEVLNKPCNTTQSEHSGGQEDQVRNNPVRIDTTSISSGDNSEKLKVALKISL
ncbi:unnamed protein product [Moneuplotes crassus]|uniref:Uncharacterized protein n=1 Tax=Euplotes crassus TaxID=5936 RepID=A0AAD1UQ18_EUPCR|nr:unnamed protein product [Moneuplotes crassus]